MKKPILLLSLLLSVSAFSVFAQNGNFSSPRFDNPGGSDDREFASRNKRGENDNLLVEGRVFWRGMVDDTVQIKIQGMNLSIQTVSGRSYGDGTFSFTSPLPDSEVLVGVVKKKGRGTVEVVQQPNSSNDFTAIVEIRDLKGGAKEYQLEIYWQ